MKVYCEKVEQVTTHMQINFKITGQSTVHLRKQKQSIISVNKLYVSIRNQSTEFSVQEESTFMAVLQFRAHLEGK
jgi:hypothetical protein